jgi:glycosyltransferase involved in cell wall biosynthesis
VNPSESSEPFRRERYVIAGGRPSMATQRVPKRVSAVITTLNNEATLAPCLDSILNQTYAPIEVIVVDGRSVDRTVEIAESRGTRIVYDDRNYGSACHRGIEVSQGDVVALFDSDIVLPHPGWLSGAIQQFDLFPNASTVYPTQRPPPGAARLTRFYLDHWLIITESRIHRRVGYFGGGNCLFLKRALDQVGNFNPEMHWGADFDIARRLCNEGFSVVFYSDPIWHDTMRSFREFVRKQKAMANTLSGNGFQMMGLSPWDSLYEQLVLGSLVFLHNLRQLDSASLIFPPYAMTRLAIYGKALWPRMKK